jgi:hypothetical protein
MPKYLVVPDGLVEGYERYGRELEAPLTKNNDNGVRKTLKSATPEPKRQRVTSPPAKIPTADNRKSSPLLEDRCCSCTKHSTCSTRRCNCYAANRECTSCACLRKCINKCVVIKTEHPNESTTLESAGPEVPPSPGRPHNLETSLVETVPWQHRTAPTSQQTNRSPNTPEEIHLPGTTENTGLNSKAEGASNGEKDKNDEAQFTEDGDMPAYLLTAADAKMDEVHGDIVHLNDGSHLTGNIPDNPKWQDYWRRLVVFPETFYNIPKGPTCERILGLLMKELLGVRDRKWNSERFFGLYDCYATEETSGFSRLQH